MCRRDPSPPPRLDLDHADRPSLPSLAVLTLWHLEQRACSLSLASVPPRATFRMWSRMVLGLGHGPSCLLHQPVHWHTGCLASSSLRSLAWSWLRPWAAPAHLFRGGWRGQIPLGTSSPQTRHALRMGTLFP